MYRMETQDKNAMAPRKDAFVGEAGSILSISLLWSERKPYFRHSNRRTEYVIVQFHTAFSWKKKEYEQGQELEIILYLESELVNSVFYQILYGVTGTRNDNMIPSGAAFRVFLFRNPLG